jgi:HlyD family secretion protein
MKWASLLAALVMSACTSPSPGMVSVPAAPTAQAPEQVTRRLPQLTPAAATGTPVATPVIEVAVQPRTAVARRGAITQTTELNGRVAGREEVALSFSARTSINSVPVRLGQPVDQGQVVAEGDTRDTAQALRQARIQVDEAGVRLNDAQQQAQARQRASITQAEDGVRAAQTNLQQVQAGALRSERESAAAGVAAARATVARAQADLARLDTRASDAELGAAADQVEATRLALRSAEADRARLLAGPDPSTVRALEREVVAARSALVTAQAEFDRLTKGSDPFQVRSSEREVERARNALKSAEATRAATKGDKSVQDAAVANAQLALDEAEDRLARLKQGPKPEEIAIGRAKVDDAQAAVAAAQAKLDAANKPADELAVDKATASVSAAGTKLRSAEAQLQALQNGVSAEQRASASDALSSAQASLVAAESRQSEIAAHPTAAELAAAENQLAGAQRQLGNARNGQINDDSSASAAAATRELERARTQVVRLEQDLEAARLRAPFSGRVASVLVQPGDILDSGRPAIIIASAGDPILVATLPAAGSRSTSAQVSTGQKAAVAIDSGDGTQLQGSVIDLAEAQNGDRLAKIQVDWSLGGPAAVGQTAIVRINVQEKQNALLIPKGALQTVGTRKYVETLDAGFRKAIDVEVGIMTAADVEILGGIQEGQAVIAGLPTGDGAAPAATTTTVVPRPTPAPVGQTAPAVTPEPALSPVLDERFDKTQTDWPNSPGSSAWLEQNAYRLAPRQLGRFVAVHAPVATALGDVEVSGRFRKVGGPPGGGYGVIVRAQQPERLDGQEQSGAYIVAAVGDRGEIGIWRRHDSVWVDLVPWTHSDAVHPGAETNEVRLRAIGDTLSLLVNGVEVATRTDTTLLKGGVGIFVGGDLNQVAVDRFVVEAPQ